MSDSSTRRPGLARAAAAVLAACLLAPIAALASEFSVSPIRVELKPGALSETITVTNHAKARLRVSVKLMEWTQDAEGKDVYKDTGDLVYFPRQLDLEPEGKRLVRLGAKNPAGLTERTYRMFIEEQPDPFGQSSTQVAFFFRFGVPIFLPPAAINPQPQPQVMEPTLDKGKLSLLVKNTGNQHFRLLRVTVDDGGGHRQEVPGWYSLAGTERTYSLHIPPEVCRKAKTLNAVVEGEGLRVDRKLNVDPTRCV